VSSKKRKPAFRDENDSDVESDDVIYPQEKRISLRRSEKGKKPHGESDSEPEQSILPKKNRSVLNASVMIEYVVIIMA